MEVYLKNVPYANNPDQSSSDLYKIESVGRACDLMHILREEGGLRMYELSQRANLSRTTTFRLLATLTAHGMVAKRSDGRYQLIEFMTCGKKYRIGYAAQSSEFGFSRAVTKGIVESAAKAGVELFVVNNEYDPTVALNNADALLREKVDLLMEFQTYTQIAPLISSQAAERKIPLIAIEIPHPNATYFGVNNCQAGLIAGRYLGRWAVHEWKGSVDEVLLLGLPQAGSFPEGRLTGSLLGMREVLPILADSKVSVLNGNGQFESSVQVVQRHLKKSTAKHILVSAINDPSALGALQAFKLEDRLRDCAIVGQNGSIEARLEMRRADTRLIGSVGYFPEQYGAQLIPLAMNIVARREPVPPAVFIKTQLLTSANLKQFYRGEGKGKGADEGQLAKAGIT
jgi:ribose transport system substrate-binding protein